jgi:hypothetical protein
VPSGRLGAQILRLCVWCQQYGLPRNGLCWHRFPCAAIATHRLTERISNDDVLAGIDPPAHANLFSGSLVCRPLRP